MAPESIASSSFKKVLQFSCRFPLGRLLYSQANLVAEAVNSQPNLGIQIFRFRKMRWGKQSLLFRFKLGYSKTDRSQSVYFYANIVLTDLLLKTCIPLTYRRG